jgi:hypothetical protein
MRAVSFGPNNIGNGSGASLGVLKARRARCIRALVRLNNIPVAEFEPAAFLDCLSWVGPLSCASWQGHLCALIMLLGNTLAQLVRVRVFVNKLAQAFPGERGWDSEWNMKKRDGTRQSLCNSDKSHSKYRKSSTTTVVSDSLRQVAGAVVTVTVGDTVRRLTRSLRLRRSVSDSDSRTDSDSWSALRQVALSH